MRARLVVGALLLTLIALPTTEARFDAYTTSTGARATAAYPETVNAGDRFFVTVNADAATGQVNSFPTAPTGWTFKGCTFVSVDASNVGSSFKAQTLQLNMTDDSCTFYVKIVWANNLGTQNGVTMVQGTTVTDDQNQNVYPRDFFEYLGWLLWLAYAVLVFRIRHYELRFVASCVGFAMLFLPGARIVHDILLFAQLALVFTAYFVPTKQAG